MKGQMKSKRVKTGSEILTTNIKNIYFKSKKKLPWLNYSKDYGTKYAWKT